MIIGIIAVWNSSEPYQQFQWLIFRLPRDWLFSNFIDAHNGHTCLWIWSLSISFSVPLPLWPNKCHVWCESNDLSWSACIGYNWLHSQLWKRFFEGENVWKDMQLLCDLRKGVSCDWIVSKKLSIVSSHTTLLGIIDRITDPYHHNSISTIMAWLLLQINWNKCLYIIPMIQRGQKWRCDVKSKKKRFI